LPLAELLACRYRPPYFFEAIFIIAAFSLALPPLSFIFRHFHSPLLMLAFRAMLRRAAMIIFRHAAAIIDCAFSGFHCFSYAVISRPSLLPRCCAIRRATY